MTEPIAYGHWPSPITAEMLTEGVVGLVDVYDAGTATVWLEGRPSEGGRQVMVVANGDGRRDLFDAPFNARSAVHEYGGGAACVAHGAAWFVNWDDQRIWRVPLDGSTVPLPVTSEADHPRSKRYADMSVSADGKWIVAVRERHVTTAGQSDEPAEVVNEVVLVTADGSGDERVVFSSSDFVMAPRWAAADRLRWIAWDHPNMPWNETRLIECDFDPATGSIGTPRQLVAGASMMEPVGDLLISDRSGYWNIWEVTTAGGTVDERQITHGETEIGGPAWNFGFRSYGVLADRRLVWAVGGILHIGAEGTDPITFDSGGVSIEQLVAADNEVAVTAVVRYADGPPGIVRFEIVGTSVDQVVIRQPDEAGVPAVDISTPQPISYPTVGGATGYGWFYPPKNSAVTAPPDTLPPLLVFIHGGPTSHARPWFARATQFWTTRGFAIVDVDHRGSTGYGTEFRDLLDGQWGVVDVEDCAAAATYLAAQGLVDGARIAIRGGSAGGFTVLGSLATTDVYAAGASLYGVADLTALATDTHKFESRYLDRMIGPWPEAREVYEERSPINRLDDFDTPLIVFQGLDDKVVPPNQSEMIVEALRAKGVECEYHTYAGEGHGFRKAETIVDQLTNELAFYRRVML